MYLDQGEIREGVRPYSLPVVIRACALGVGTQLGVPHPLEVRGSHSVIWGGILATAARPSVEKNKVDIKGINVVSNSAKRVSQWTIFLYGIHNGYPRGQQVFGKRNHSISWSLLGLYSYDNDVRNVNLQDACRASRDEIKLSRKRGTTLMLSPERVSYAALVRLVLSQNQLT